MSGKCKEGKPKRIESAWNRANSFLLDKIIFQKGTGVQYANLDPENTK